MTIKPHGLFGRYSDAASDQATALVLAWLEEQGYCFIGVAGGANVLDAQHVWYSLGDNGGEINVERINVPATLVSVATDFVKAPLPTLATTAYRLLCALRGDPVDYLTSFPATSPQLGKKVYELETNPTR